MTTDRRPQPYSLPVSMVFTLVGLILLAVASSFPLILLAAALVGIGSSVFHPESSRVAPTGLGGQARARSIPVSGRRKCRIGDRAAAGGVCCRAVGTAEHRAVFGDRTAGDLRAVVGQSLVPGASVRTAEKANVREAMPEARLDGVARRVLRSDSAAADLSKYFYLVSLSSYYTFYLIDKFGVSVQTAQIYLFVFLGAVATGTLAGRPVGDRSLQGGDLGLHPGGAAFTILLPHANLFWTGVLTVPIGLDPGLSIFAIMVYAQELVPAASA